MSVYDLKPRFQALLRPLVDALAGAGARHEDTGRRGLERSGRCRLRRSPLPADGALHRRGPLAGRAALSRAADHAALLLAVAAIPIQYAWVSMEWYGMFIIFIPVYMFLALPVRLVLSKETSGFVASLEAAVRELKMEPAG